MKVAVMGAGAVGSYFGARLHQAGHEVTLIGRPALVDAVRLLGLRLQMQGFDGRLPLQASTDPGAAAAAELVLFCVKSQDTGTAGTALKGILHRPCTVLCLQNGVDNAQLLSQVLGFDAVPVAVYVAVEMPAPGHVLHNGRGELLIGPSPRSERIAQVFVRAGIQAQVTPTVMHALWAKLTANCAWNAISALTQLPYGELARREGVEDTLRAIVAECRTVSAAEGFSLPAGLWDEVWELSRSMPAQKSSTAQDLARGRPTEIDYINGHVVRRARLHGIEVPANRLLHTLVKIREQG